MKNQNFIVSSKNNILKPGKTFNSLKNSWFFYEKLQKRFYLN
jgi:hypothetical protein